MPKAFNMSREVCDSFFERHTPYCTTNYLLNFSPFKNKYATLRGNYYSSNVNPNPLLACKLVIQLFGLGSILKFQFKNKCSSCNLMFHCMTSLSPPPTANCTPNLAQGLLKSNFHGQANRSIISTEGNFHPNQNRYYFALERISQDV